MSEEEEKSIMVALLDDASMRVIPRLCNLQRRMEEGEELSGNDTHFCGETLEKLRFCLGHSARDPDCEQIFSSITHQLYQVLNLAGRQLREPARA